MVFMPTNFARIGTVSSAQTGREHGWCAHHRELAHVDQNVRSGASGRGPSFFVESGPASNGVRAGLTIYRCMKLAAEQVAE